MSYCVVAGDNISDYNKRMGSSGAKKLKKALMIWHEKLGITTELQIFKLGSDNAMVLEYLVREVLPSQA